MTKQQLLQEIRRILQKEPDRMYSREEILNLLGEKGDDPEIESLLAELEVSSSLKESRSDVYATCRGGTVYYKWNR
ncbi:MAG: hypothetical protein QXJ74_07985 [Nitrososphaera sp.]|uniref:hypothetical protein n=1 Tax=Nitrososphaera sp. TaxID=1971748 RepID=UPI0018117BA3|nr:hypothetical protein [Nitrososphaera sp.]NWG36956.1 hypothetical protein [Nitrososphaera sp.]